MTERYYAKCPLCGEVGWFGHASDTGYYFVCGDNEQHYWGETLPEPGDDHFENRCQEHFDMVQKAKANIITDEEYEHIRQRRRDMLTEDAKKQIAFLPESRQDDAEQELGKRPPGEQTLETFLVSVYKKAVNQNLEIPDDHQAIAAAYHETYQRTLDAIRNRDVVAAYGPKAH